MGEEEKYLDAFRTTLPVLIDKEMKKIRQQQRGLTMLLSVLLGMNMLMFGIGLWVMMRSNATTETALPDETEQVAIHAPAQTVDVLADLPEPEPEAEAEEQEDFSTRIEHSQEVTRRSLNRMRQDAEQQQKVADDAAEATRPAVANTARPDFVITQSGMTLRSLARRYYGSEVFWVCIYDRNSQVLRTPDVLPLSVRLHLPRPADYGIDATDPSSLRRARALAKSLLGQ